MSEPWPAPKEVLEVMEAERGCLPPAVMDRFQNVSWERLVALCLGESPDTSEQNVLETFGRIYGERDAILHGATANRSEI